jgi:hypothetical protein
MASRFEDRRLQPMPYSGIPTPLARPSEIRTALKALIAQADALIADLGVDWKQGRDKGRADALGQLKKQYSKRLEEAEPNDRQAVNEDWERERQQIESRFSAARSPILVHLLLEKVENVLGDIDSTAACASEAYASSERIKKLEFLADDDSRCLESLALVKRNLLKVVALTKIMPGKSEPENSKRATRRKRKSSGKRDSEDKHLSRRDQEIFEQIGRRDIETQSNKELFLRRSKYKLKAITYSAFRHSLDRIRECQKLPSSSAVKKTAPNLGTETARTAQRFLGKA